MMGVEGFFLILGLISLSLGIFNLLPIPMLDGGQIMVLAIEKVMSWFGRTLSMVAQRTNPTHRPGNSITVDGDCDLF